MNERVAIFSIMLVVISVSIGVFFRKKREKRVAESISADTTEKQANDILNKVLPNGSSFKAVPALVKLTASQSAAVYGKDIVKGTALSLLTGRSVNYHSDQDGDDSYMIAYNGNDLYLISLDKDYQNHQIKADDNVPLHINKDSAEKVKYKSRSYTATVYLKDSKSKFSLQPQLAFFDKEDNERLEACKDFLTRFAEEF